MERLKQVRITTSSLKEKGREHSAERSYFHPCNIEAIWLIFYYLLQTNWLLLKQNKITLQRVAKLKTSWKIERKQNRDLGLQRYAANVAVVIKKKKYSNTTKIGHPSLSGSPRSPLLLQCCRAGSRYLHADARTPWTARSLFPRETTWRPLPNFPLFRSLLALGDFLESHPHHLVKFNQFVLDFPTLGTSKDITKLQQW